MTGIAPLAFGGCRLVRPEYSIDDDVREPCRDGSQRKSQDAAYRIAGHQFPTFIRGRRSTLSPDTDHMPISQGMDLNVFRAFEFPGRRRREET
jgi:hypothetical protein